MKTLSAYRFSSNYCSHVRNFATDDEAFRYNSEYADDASCSSIYKLKGSDWFVWDIEDQTWIYDPKETQNSKNPLTLVGL